LRGGLSMVFKLDNLLNALAIALHKALDPLGERCYIGILIAEPLR
jgi:hypothetical protein